MLLGYSTELSCERGAAGTYDNGGQVVPPRFLPARLSSLPSRCPPHRRDGKCGHGSTHTLPSSLGVWFVSALIQNEKAKYGRGPKNVLHDAN